VAALRDQLAWFERRPLFGLRVLVPRSRTQRSRLARNLTALGADVLEAPRMSIEPGTSAALGAAVRELGRYEWVALTSPTAVERFWSELLEAGLDVRALAGVRFACFGTTTGAALLKHGIRPDFARPTFAPSAAAALAEEARIDGARVLFPREAGATSPLAAALAGLGALVDEVEAYRERLDADAAAEVRRRLDDGEIDVIAFASSRTVRSFAEAVGPEVGGAAVAAIGASTARTALSLGLPVHHLPEEATLRGLIEGLRELARSTQRRPHAHAGAPARRARVAL
jgi:uroporphyrinogen III methyltransferase/synthase